MSDRRGIAAPRRPSSMSLTRAEAKPGANGMSPVVDLWPLYRSARAEAKELDAAARAALKCHSSCHYNKHGELLRAEYKRLVQLWKEKQRQATNLLEEASGIASQRHTRKRRFCPYRRSSHSAKPSTASDAFTTSTDICSSRSPRLRSPGGTYSSVSDMPPRKRRFSPYRRGSRSGRLSSASDTLTSSSDIYSSDGETSGSSGGTSSSPSEMPTRKRRLSPYRFGSHRGGPSSASDTFTSSSDTSSSDSDTSSSSSDSSSSDSETSSSSGGTYSSESPSDTPSSYVDVQ